MRIEIIRANGDLKREIWIFELYSEHIYFEHYAFQTKETKRHKVWRSQTHWTRMFERDNNIDKPLIPSDIRDEVYQRIKDYIITIPITS